MAKTAGDVSELDRLRGETWVDHCLAVAECKTLSKLHAKVPVLASVDLWSKYRGGKAKPLESTVRAVNLLLPSTADTWFQGPQGLPLWSVLALDLAASRQLVEKAISEHFYDRKDWMLVSKKAVPSMDNLELVQSLLELTIPSAWPRPVPDPDMSDWAPPARLSETDEFLARYEEENRRREELMNARRPYWGWPQDHYYSLAEVINGDHSVLIAAHETHLSLKKSSRPVERGIELAIADFVARNNIPKNDILKPDRTIVLLAAAVVCNSSEELLLKDVAYFLTTGLKPVLQDHFGDGVAQFVEDNI